MSKFGRLLAAMVMIVVVASILGPAPCSMRPTPAPGSDDHACCANGLSAARPACCHAEMAASTPGVVGYRAAAAAPAVTTMVWDLAPATISAPTRTLATPHSYKSPPTVLRV